jgi:hypothetical protein
LPGWRGSGLTIPRVHRGDSKREPPGGHYAILSRLSRRNLIVPLEAPCHAMARGPAIPIQYARAPRRKKGQPNDPKPPATTPKKARTQVRDKAKVVGRWHDNRGAIVVS